MEPYHPSLDFGAVGVLDAGDYGRGVVVLRSTRLGGLLGVGPGGERFVHAVAHGHRLRALSDGARAARYAEDMDSEPHHYDLPADVAGHLPHPERRHRERACL